MANDVVPFRFVFVSFAVAIPALPSLLLLLPLPPCQKIILVQS